MVRAYPAVLHAVERHEISEKRLDDSVARILALKWRLGLIRDPFVNVGNVNNVVGTPHHLAVAQQVADNSITLIKNSAGLLPLAKNSGKKVLVTGTGSAVTTTIGTGVAARGLSSDVFTTTFGHPSDAEIATAVSKANQDDLVVVTTFNAWGDSQRMKLVNQLLATGKPVVVVAVGTPYDVAYFPNASTFVTTYSFTGVSMQPLVKVLFGETQPGGKLPVTINEPPPSTVVSYPFGFHLALP